MSQHWAMTTIAGTGKAGYAGDGGPAPQALLNNPFDLAFDPSGSLCFSDTYNHCIRRIDARTGVISTIAGTGQSGFAGDGGPATQAQINQPYGIVIDRAGNTYIADRLNKRVRRVYTMDTSQPEISSLQPLLWPNWSSRMAWHWIASIAAYSSLTSPIIGFMSSSLPPAPLSHLPEPATIATPVTAVRPRRRTSSALAPSHWRQTIPSTFWNGRAAACAACATASSRPSPAPARVATQATTTTHDTQCSMRRRRWHSIPRATCSSSTPKIM